MANDFIWNILESARDDLVSDEVPKLEKKLAELDEECCQFFSHQDRDDSFKLLSVQLVKEAIKITNVQLCLLALKRLKLNQLISLLNPDITSSSEIFKLVSNYFQLGELEADPTDTKTGHRLVPETNLDHDKQGSNAIKSSVQEPSNVLSQLKTAQDNETEENFGDALSLYESTGTCHANFLRVSMKHLMCASHDVLQKYCTDRFDLQPVWFDYLLECKRFKDAVGFCESIGDKPPGLLSKSAKQQRGNKLLELLPNELHEFALASLVKWTDVRQLDTVASIGTNDRDIRSQQAEISTHYLKHDNLNIALSIAFSLNRADLVLDQYLARADEHPINLNSVCRHGSVYFNNAHLLRHLMNVICYNMTPDRIIIKSVCMNLGLLDELLQMLPASYNSSDFALSQLLDRLEVTIESGSPEKLDTIDPQLRKSTMTTVFRFIEQEGERNLTLQLVTIMISAITIYLLKLDPTGGSLQTTSGGPSVVNLESMFESISQYLEGSTFNVSDSLVRATNNLVIAIKGKLDALADSEIIRDSFMKIVDKIAGLCLIDARYKSAAILYSQVEDNVNAVKALMRTGETDTVMNYALLVRDITVNRITINYIKHLKLEPEIIEDFIRRSKL